MLTNEECAQALEVYPNDQPDTAFLKYSFAFKDPPTAVHAIYESIHHVLDVANNQSESTRRSNLGIISQFKQNRTTLPQALDAALHYINSHLVLQGCVVIGPSIFFILYEIMFGANEIHKYWFEIAVRGAIGFAAQGLAIDDLSSIRRFTFGAQVGKHTANCEKNDHKSCHDHFSTISINLRSSSEGCILGTIAIYDSLQKKEDTTLDKCHLQILAAKEIVEIIVGKVQWDAPVAPKTPVQQSASGQSCSSFTAHYALKAHLGLMVYKDHPCEEVLNQQAYEMASVSLHLSPPSSTMIKMWHDVYQQSLGTTCLYPGENTPSISLTND